MQTPLNPPMTNEIELWKKLTSLVLYNSYKYTSTTAFWNKKQLVKFQVFYSKGMKCGRQICKRNYFHSAEFQQLKVWVWFTCIISSNSSLINYYLKTLFVKRILYDSTFNWPWRTFFPIYLVMCPWIPLLHQDVQGKAALNEHSARTASARTSAE